MSPLGAEARLWAARWRDSYAAYDCAQIARMVATDSMFILATITVVLAATAAAIRAFRAVENQSLLAIVAGKALWAELPYFKKTKLAQNKA
jgi:hypothetical protein